MKITCPCGGLISDSTDYIPYKAHLIADQDECASWDEYPDDYEARINALRPLVRSVYECQSCGRLCLDGLNGDLVWYRPESGGPTGVLGSKLGSAFKVHMGGRWSGNARTPGELWWAGSGDIPGGYERFKSLVSLQVRYGELKARLRREGRLRKAFLSIDGEIVDIEE